MTIKTLDHEKIKTLVEKRVEENQKEYDELMQKRRTQVEGLKTMKQTTMTRYDYEKVKDCIANNDTTGAYIILATQFNLLSLRKILKYINAIHNIEGNMPLNLREYRDEIGQEILEHIEQYYNISVFLAVQACL